jgi:cell division transport system permease protein
MILFSKRVIRDILANGFLNAVTVVTIALSVLIVSAFVLFIINANDMLNLWTKGIRMMAYLEPGTPPARIEALEHEIRRLPGVSELELVSKEEGLNRLKQQLKHQSSLIEDLRENPLPDAYEIRVDERLTRETYETLAGKIERLRGVGSVEFGKAWLSRFANFFNLFKIATYALGCLFFLAAVFFVANTIRLVLYSRREEIEIMRLVGASEGFIKDPLYLQSLVLGALGGFMGMAVLFVIYTFISSRIEPYEELTAGLFQIRFLPPRMIGMMIGGCMLTGWIGCFLSLRHFFKEDSL